MPIIKSAKKAIRGSLRKKAFNDRQKHAMKDVIKKIEKTAKTDKKEAEKQPDYNIVLSERSKPAPQVEGAPGPDDIPF